MPRTGTGRYMYCLVPVPLQQRYRTVPVPYTHTFFEKCASTCLHVLYANNYLNIYQKSY